MIAALVDLLAISYQAGDMAQLEAIARSMLAAIPDDIVAVQFLGLALYQTGHINKAYETFKRLASDNRPLETGDAALTCEFASTVSYRLATQAYSGLADAWYRIALVLRRFDLPQAASRALAASSAARPSPGWPGDAVAARPLRNGGIGNGSEEDPAAPGFVAGP